MKFIVAVVVTLFQQYLSLSQCESKKKHHRWKESRRNQR